MNNLEDVLSKTDAEPNPIKNSSVVVEVDFPIAEPLSCPFADNE